MDPDEALYQLLLAMHDGDSDDVLSWLEDLKGWIAGGGALPNVEQVMSDLMADSEDGEEGEAVDAEHDNNEDGTDEDLEALTEHNLQAEAEAAAGPIEAAQRPLGPPPKLRRSSRGQ